ncbi:Mur ligase family protein, partial [uncultured Planktomarina sp.]
MIAVQGMHGRRVFVLGMGRSGLVAAQALVAGGADVLCWDDGETGRQRAEEAGLSCSDPLRGGLEGVDMLITSPGIAHLYPKPHPAIGMAMQLGIPLDNDIGLFFRSFATQSWTGFDMAPKVIAVTGSNGKSTTSALIHHLLEVAGRRSQLAGNIGRGVLDLQPAEDGDVIVLELSSYQLELARSLTPDIAVFT